MQQSFEFCRYGQLSKLSTASYSLNVLLLADLSALPDSVQSALEPALSPIWFQIALIVMIIILALRAVSEVIRYWNQSWKLGKYDKNPGWRSARRYIFGFVIFIISICWIFGMRICLWTWLVGLLNIQSFSGFCVDICSHNNSARCFEHRTIQKIRPVHTRRRRIHLWVNSPRSRHFEQDITRVLAGILVLVIITIFNTIICVLVSRNILFHAPENGDDSTMLLQEFSGNPQEPQGSNNQCDNRNSYNPLVLANKAVPIFHNSTAQWWAIVVFEELPL